MINDFQPGDWVKLPAQPEWGHGQVQSALGEKVTVNFEHAGKQVILTSEVHLEPVARED